MTLKREPGGAVGPAALLISGTSELIPQNRSRDVDCSLYIDQKVE
jgi:hypothetical protein